MEEKLIRKLIKLISLRDGAKAIESHEEAKNAQSKIDVLLAQVGKTEDDILAEAIAEDGDKPIDVTVKVYHIAEDLIKTEGDWKPALLGIIARMNKCKILLHGSRKDAPVSIIGDEFNIEVTIATYKHLVPLIKAKGNTRYREYSRAMSTSAQFEKRNTFLRGYFKGVPQGMNQWWDEYLTSQKTQQVGLMKLGEIERHQHAVGSYINQRYGRLGTKKGTQASGKMGRAAGATDGYSMGRQGGTSSRSIGMG